MSTGRGGDTDGGASPDHSEGERSRFAAGDDERENREQIARTGEPQRDALGNGEGAS